MLCIGCWQLAANPQGSLPAVSYKWFAGT